MKPIGMWTTKGWNLPKKEEISNTLIDYFFEGRVPPECVKLSEDIHANPMFRLRWYEC